MTDLHIRPATSADIPAITANYGREVEEGIATFELDPPDETEMARRMAAVLDGGYPYLAAELDGALVGSCYAGPFRSRPAFRATVEDSIYLLPAAQGRGIGRKLLTRLIDETERRGFRQMVAVISDTINPGSVRLHGALGFQTIGVMPDVGYKHGKWIETVIMQRALGEGSTTPPG